MAKDGGSAFPEIETDTAYDDEHKLYSRTYSYGGMTLRDYFAAAALQGLLASREFGGAAGNDPDKGAAWAYQMADAMLNSRSTRAKQE